MPSGAVHLKYYTGLAPLAVPLIVLGLLTLTGDPLPPVMGAVGYALGYYISPDLDLIGITSDEGRMMRHFKVIGMLFVAWWLFYAGIVQIFGGHRSWFSHSYIFSTLVRIIWMGLPWLILWLWVPDTPPIAWRSLWAVLWPVWVGLGVADGIHIYLDRNA